MLYTPQGLFRRRAYALLVLALAAVSADFVQAEEADFEFEVTDEEYYRMPPLFHLDDYKGCLSRPAGAYCVGSFVLDDDDGRSTLLQLMKRYSANWVDRYNHTLLHRGVCVTDHCPAAAGDDDLPLRFAGCVNTSVWTSHGLHARLYNLEYCRTGAEHTLRLAAPPTTGERALTVLGVALLTLAMLSTACDLLLPANHPHRKQAAWALTWSVPGSWRTLTAHPPRSSFDLSACDGLRVICMLCVIVEHVCWLTFNAYVADTRYAELMRRAVDAMLMVNSSLVVQVFFILSNFLLANKLIHMVRAEPPSAKMLVSTLVNRFVRISPAYWAVVAYAGTWWVRVGDGPLWAPMVEREAAACRTKGWAQMLYLNNVVATEGYCLIQTWYLAADMQLYAVGAVLTLALARWGRGRAIEALVALWTAATAAQFVLTYGWRLQPNLVVHRPEAVRTQYAQEPSFDLLYQSPLGNAPAALAGLILAHIHQRMVDAGIRLAEYPVWAWTSRLGGPLAIAWLALSPLLVGTGPPTRLGAAALAAAERPVFAAFVAFGLLGAFQNVHTPWRSWLSWRGWAVPARLSFAALLLHMVVDKTLVASRPYPSLVSRLPVFVEWFGVTMLSYALALPLALLVEVPPVRLFRIFTTPKVPAHSTHPINKVPAPS